MNLTDSSKTSLHYYYYRKLTGTKENWNVDIRGLRVKY